MPGTLLVEYEDPESKLLLAQNQQVFVCGRVNRTLWNVETAAPRKQELLVPAVYVVLRVPDLDAINLALVYANATCHASRHALLLLCGIFLLK